MRTSFVPGWCVGVLLVLLVGVLAYAALFHNSDVADLDDEDDEDNDHDWYDGDDENDWLEPQYTIPDEVQSRMQHHRNPTADELRESVIGLWNEGGGWIPGGAYADLAYVLGVEPARLVHYDNTAKAHHFPEGYNALGRESDD